MTINDTLIIEELDPVKLPLVKKLYKAHYPSGKAKKDEQILIAKQNGQIAALLRLKCVEQYRLLTGMLVVPEARGRGVGDALLDYCENKVFNNHDFCFAFSYLEHYYSKHGFKPIEIQDLPNSLRLAFLRYIDSGKDLIPMQYTP
ncbi:GNAT family N-acetyltransferase [Vibrio sp. CAU 1672]|uniref:GNAT family N-acetyltransferase n=1 Tax=Vibrio sp. CAU 1672 TaxID=3032594 RepID=UPI0023DB4E99|nr:GNAT family N-acetyltransferase [Vibrio sp. CAU 1672]MDF2156143.1 GNAT family N-acetyltransferase [Vibrio sp. CAU 1672]